MVSDDELLAMLNTADVCVNPDRFNEMNDKSTMNKIMEYMALGKPIVQFDLKEGRYSAQDASLSAWVSHDGVSTGLRGWHAMRILLTAIDPSGKKMWELPHVLQQSQGSGPWRFVSRVFYLPPSVAALEVYSGLNRVTGRMQVRDLVLEVVHERPLFKISRLILTLIWPLVALWLIWPLWRQRGLAVIVVGCTILIGTLTPHSVKLELRHFLRDSVVQAPIHQAPIHQAPAHQAPAHQESAPSAAAVQNDEAQAKSIAAGVTKSTVATPAIPISEIWRSLHKLGHVGLFALLAIVAGWAWPRELWWRQGLLLVVFAASAETSQLLTPDRSANALDAGLNILGILVGISLWQMLTARRSTAPDLPTA